MIFSSFEGEPEELIKHGLRALRETLPNEQELTTKVLSNAFIYSGVLYRTLIFRTYTCMFKISLLYVICS